MSHRVDGVVDGVQNKVRDGSPCSAEDPTVAELGEIKDREKNKKSKVKAKIIRVLTVVAYVLSVSLAAIMLSLYYVFLWDPKMPGGAGRLQADADLAEGEGLTEALRMAEASALALDPAPDRVDPPFDANASEAGASRISGASTPRWT